MYAQAAIKSNTLLRNGAYGIVMRGVQKCTRGCSSLRGRNRLPLCCIKLDTATDPACGTAGFLISSAEYIRSEYGNKMTAEQWEKYGSETFTGFDTDETMCRLSCMNLMLHSVINPQLNKQDSVSKDYQVKDAYDLILANPPFKGTINKENINESLLAITNTTKTELLFVALFIRLLRVGGRCAWNYKSNLLSSSLKPTNQKLQCGNIKNLLERRSLSWK